jgi:hypothetical protein
MVIELDFTSKSTAVKSNNLRHSGQVLLPEIITDMIEITACIAPSTEAEFCIRYYLTVHTNVLRLLVREHR